MSEAASEAEAGELRSEMAELRHELGEVKALLKDILSRRKPRKPPPPLEVAAPELRQDVRDKLARAATRRRVEKRSSGGAR